jgi:hypothetical protein
MVETAEMRLPLGRDVFDYQLLTACLAHLSKPRDKIHRLLAKGDIVRIRKGLYAFGLAYRRQPLSREVLANLIYGPSYLSLEYAGSRPRAVTCSSRSRSACASIGCRTCLRESSTPFSAGSGRAG